MPDGCCTPYVGDGDMVTPAAGIDLWLVQSVKRQVLV